MKSENLLPDHQDQTESETNTELNFADQTDETRIIPRKGKNDLVLAERDVDRVIEMAWEDRTPFGAIEMQFGLTEGEVIRLMRRELKPKSWRNWRARVQGRSTKHQAQRQDEVLRFKSRMQRTITKNKISKR